MVFSTPPPPTYEYLYSCQPSLRGGVNTLRVSPQSDGLHLRGRGEEEEPALRWGGQEWGWNGLIRSEIEKRTQASFLLWRRPVSQSFTSTG